MTQLPQRLSDGDRHGVGEVQAADTIAAQRNAHRDHSRRLEEILRQALDLAAKQQAVAGLVGDIGVKALGARREAEDSAPLGQGLAEGVHVRVLHAVDVLPVVEPGASAGALVGTKPEQPNQVKARPHSEGQPANVPRVLGNLRPVKSDMK